MSEHRPTRPVPGPPPASRPALAPVPTREDLAQQMRESHDVLFEMINELSARLRALDAALDARVTQLEQAQPVPRRNAVDDELAQKVLATLRAHPGFKVTGMTIATNLGLEPTQRGKVYTRLDALYKAGKLFREAGGKGQNAVYWAEAEAKSA